MNNSRPAPSDRRPSRSNPKPLFHFWRCFWLAFLVVSVAYAWHCFYVPENGIAWAEDFNSAQVRATESGKPIILYFTGTWCVPCRIMKRQVWADQEVMELVHQNFVPLAIEVGNPENAALMAAYKIEGPPVTLVCDPNGDVLDWRAGGISKAELLELLRSEDVLRNGNVQPARRPEG